MLDSGNPEGDALPSRPHILIVEDDLHVAQGLLGGLRDAGFETSLSMAGNEALERLLLETFDLVLLDLMLPGRSGFDILESVRNRVSVPIIVLSARTELPDRLRSFEGGAVDFVPKPFFMEELVARIRARLAMTAWVPHRRLPLADVIVDLDARKVDREGVDLELTSHEFNVLAFLRERSGRAVTRMQIAEAALPERGERNDRTVDSHLSRIRKKLGPLASGRIKTVWGIGYMCAAEDT